MRRTELLLLQHSIKGLTGITDVPELTSCHEESEAAMLKLILEAQYPQALQLPSLARSLLIHSESAGPSEYYSSWARMRIQQAGELAEAAAAKERSEEQEGDEIRALLLTAVTCLLTFVQHNVTG